MAGYGQMMKQMKKMQRDIENKQKELDVREFSANAGSDMVKVTALGSREITAITIDPTFFKEEDQEMITDLIRLAVNTVIADIEKISEEEIGKITGGMNMPGLF